ncbi:hypothetical protein [Ensifer sesbaniae]|uniref:hypothetical protein n=1 Tax=Ensifer sesbaniae TaxID=1214071 RepID=UPI00156958E8|nr:hypothetical protein [Ensifer sesbaniae]
MYFLAVITVFRAERKCLDGKGGGAEDVIDPMRRFDRVGVDLSFGDTIKGLGA